MGNATASLGGSPPRSHVWRSRSSRTSLATSRFTPSSTATSRPLILTSDGRRLVMSRYTQPDEGLKLLMAQMKKQLGDQPPPRLEAASEGVGNATVKM